MKLTRPACVLLVLLLAGCSKSDSGNDAAATNAATDVPAESSPMDAAKPIVASATGTIESIDTAAGKITLAHGPVEALDWPAMTMAFKATPAQIAAVQAGQQVDFQFESRGMDATITQIEPAR